MEKTENEKMGEVTDIIERLSPIERRIVPFLKENIININKKSGLDEISVLRALRFLESKGVLKLQIFEKKTVDIGTNGIYYKKNNLPERRLLILLGEKNHLSLDDARKLSKLSENEFKVSIGVLKSKALINMANNKISLNASK